MDGSERQEDKPYRWCLHYHSILHTAGSCGANYLCAEVRFSEKWVGRCADSHHTSTLCLLKCETGTDLFYLWNKTVILTRVLISIHNTDCVQLVGIHIKGSHSEYGSPLALQNKRWLTSTSRKSWSFLHVAEKVSEVPNSKYHSLFFVLKERRQQELQRDQEKRKC